MAIGGIFSEFHAKVADAIERTPDDFAEHKERSAQEAENAAEETLFQALEHFASRKPTAEEIAEARAEARAKHDASYAPPTNELYDSTDEAVAEVLGDEALGITDEQIYGGVIYEDASEKYAQDVGDDE